MQDTETQTRGILNSAFASLCLVLIVFAASTPIVPAQTNWVSNGPEGGSIWSIHLDPVTTGTVYAGIYGGGGFAKSTNGGDDWHRTPTGLSQHNGFSCIAAAPSMPAQLYAGAYGVYVSSDGGATWIPDSGGLNTNVYAVAAHPTDPMVAFAAASWPTLGVFKTIDGGSSWVNVSGSLPRNDVNELKIPLTSPDVMFAATTRGMFKTTDGASTWQPGGLDHYNVHSIALNRQLPDRLVAGTRTGVFRSEDGGQTWQATALMGVEVLSVDSDPRDTDVYYAAVRDLGVHRSDDGGTTWAPTVIGLDNLKVEIVATDPHNPEWVYCGTKANGVYRSTDGGSTWLPSNRGIREIEFSDLATHPTDRDTVFAASLGGGVWQSTDGTSSWKLLSLAGEWIYSVVIHPGTPSTLYAAQLHEGVLRSLDSGLSWSTVNAGAPLWDITFVVMRPDAPILFAGTSTSGLFRSVDGANSWVQLDVGATTSRRMAEIGFDPSNPTTVYVATQTGELFKSTDSGDIWIPAASGLTNPTDLVVDPRNPSMIYIPTYYGSIMKSSDGGSSFDPLGTAPSAGHYSLEIDPHIENRLYLSVSRALDGGGVFRSDDGGLSWIDVTTSDEPRHATGILIEPRSPETLYAITEGGVYSRDLSSVPVEITSFTIE